MEFPKVHIVEEPPSFFGERFHVYHNGYYRETRNNVMRQFFYMAAEIMQNKHRQHVYPWYDIDSRVTVPAGRISVFWPLPPASGHYPQDFDNCRQWTNRLFDSLYEALQNQNMRLTHYGLRPYRVGYDLLNYGVQLEFLVPSHWPELSMLPGPCNLYQLLHALGVEKEHVQKNRNT